jgi:hypothetical protein
MLSGKIPQYQELVSNGVILSAHGSEQCEIRNVISSSTFPSTRASGCGSRGHGLSETRARQPKDKKKKKRETEGMKLIPRWSRISRANFTKKHNKGIKEKEEALWGVGLPVQPRCSLFQQNGRHAHSQGYSNYMRTMWLQFFMPGAIEHKKNSNIHKSGDRSLFFVLVRLL